MAGPAAVLDSASKEPQLAWVCLQTALWEAPTCALRSKGRMVGQPPCRTSRCSQRGPQGTPACRQRGGREVGRRPFRQGHYTAAQLPEMCVRQCTSLHPGALPCTAQHGQPSQRTCTWGSPSRQSCEPLLLLLGRAGGSSAAPPSPALRPGCAAPRTAHKATNSGSGSHTHNRLWQLGCAALPRCRTAAQPPPTGLPAALPTWMQGRWTTA